MSDHVRLK